MGSVDPSPHSSMFPRVLYQGNFFSFLGTFLKTDFLYLFRFAKDPLKEVSVPLGIVVVENDSDLNAVRTVINRYVEVSLNSGHS